MAPTEYATSRKAEHVKVEMEAKEEAAPRNQKKFTPPIRPTRCPIEPFALSCSHQDRNDDVKGIKTSNAAVEGKVGPVEFATHVKALPQAQ